MEETGTAVRTTEQAQPHRRRSRAQRGSIIKRGDTWTIVYRTPEGKQKWEGGFLKKDRAQARLDEVLGAIRNDKYVERTEMLFKTFCDDWMEGAKANTTPATWCSYRSALKNWIAPAFGEQPLCDIRKADVMKFLKKLLGNESISRKFVKNVHALLHVLFEDAIEMNLIAANPAHKRKSRRGDREAVAAAAIKRYVPPPTDVVKAFANLTPTYQALLATGALTGMRRGELVGLHWKDINWAGGKIHVRRALRRVPKKLMDAGGFRDVERIGETGLAIGPPKTKNAVRFIDMGQDLATVLETLRQQQNGSSAPFVFQTEIGGPLDPDGIYDVLYAAQDAAKVRRFGLHGLRHLYCSLLQENGASLKFAQEKLGHADPATTSKIYTHVVDDHGREFAEKLEAALPFTSVSLTLAKPGTSGAQRETVN